ncbi:cytochrome P450 27C1 isoform X2 [Mustela putorius furo]|uniref:Cytochrome P450 27C1 isoform X2 n=1 Tax=Mustela putorius furo TaxID=9669 RepID=A0A8U0RFT1_MUSPF|nr:cytochrome P450 27C1 isoform X2 [Mustela putorius furo]
MPRRYEFEEALLEHVEAEQRATPKDNSSPNKKIASNNQPTQTDAMALLARILKAPVSPAPGRGGFLGAGAPRPSRPEGARLPAGARAEDKGAGRRGAPRAGSQAEGPRSLAAMPGPRTLANLVEFFWKDGFSRIHEIQTETWWLRCSGQRGPRPREPTWGPGRSTDTCEGDPPGSSRREEGEQWLKMRRVLRQRILKPRDVAIFSSEINQVIADLIKRIYVLKSQAEDGETVTNVNDLFFKYSMEGVATILYESRLGCLEDSIPQATVDYIEALGLMFSMFKTSMYAGAIPRWLRPFIPKPWREFCRSWDGLFRFSQIHVDNKLKDIQSHMDSGESVRGGLLTCLFLSQELTLEEIYANMTEMLLAGVDTTSFTLSWAVYLLARHPEVQQMVYQEILKNLGDRHVPTAADVPKVPLVRALLKETLRLFPVLPGNGRVTQEDLVIGGYLIPKGTQLALCHYATSYADENFPRAKEFRPERWLRKGRLDRVDNFGSIPFGYGVRSCIGRRIAELEIHLLVIQLLQHFEIKTSSWTKAVPAKTHGLLTPGGPIHVRFVNRK